MKKATIAALVGVVLSAALAVAASLEGCALHNPAPCTGGEYPDPCVAGARDAGRDR